MLKLQASQCTTLERLFGWIRSIDSMKNIGPRRFEAPSQTIQIIHRHIPLSGLNPLQGSAVNIRFFSQLLLGKLGCISQPIDIPTYGNMHLSRSIHQRSMIG